MSKRKLAMDIINFLESYFKGDNVQIFYVPALNDDARALIYSKDDVKILHSREWGYIDILGLSKDDVELIKNYFSTQTGSFGRVYFP